MKWTKHETDSRRTLFIKSIIRHLGHKFAFVWYCIVEIIAERYRNDGDSFAVTLHVSDWLSETNLHPNAKDRFLKLIEFASGHQKVTYKLLDNNLTVELLEVAEIADEYTRKIRSKSRQSPLQSKEKEKKKRLKSPSDAVGDEQLGFSENKIKLQKGSAKSSRAWEAYSIAMLKVHGAVPPRNKKINALLCQIVDRVGDDHAVQLVSHFVNHQNNFYRSRGHQLDFALRDAEALLLEIKKGKPNDSYQQSSGSGFRSSSVRTGNERQIQQGEISALRSQALDSAAGLEEHSYDHDIDK
ncbi:MAG: hypothetical protein AB7H97_11305 [Pseudobdellovibrionaceae bacterium]